MERETTFNNHQGVHHKDDMIIIIQLTRQSSYLFQCKRSKMDPL